MCDVFKPIDAVIGPFCLLMAETGGWPTDGQVEEARVRASVQHVCYQHEELQVRDCQHLQGELMSHG